MSLWKRQPKQPKLLYTPCNGHQAGALIYTKKLYQADDLDKKPTWKKWLKLRKKWMVEQEEIHGKSNLTCSLCGKTNLDPWTTDKNKLATIDHILPCSRYPHLWNVTTNFQVACYRCNNKKGNTVTISVDLV